MDENVRRLESHHLEWADAVFFSGMHPQKARLNRLLQESNARGRLTVVGGPSANIWPEYYPAADAVHQGGRLLLGCVKIVARQPSWNS